MSMTLQTLAIQTVTKPAEAARVILSRDWPREVLWTGLMLAMVLNTILFVLQGILFPLPDGMPGARMSATGYFALFFAMQIVFIYAVFFAGRWMRGAASLGEVMALMIWIQYLQFVLHVGLLVVVMIAPGLGGMLNIVATVVAFFVMLHFINEAHGFGSLMKSFGVLLLATLAVAVGLTILFSMFGLSILGLSTNV